MSRHPKDQEEADSESFRKVSDCPRGFEPCYAGQKAWHLCCPWFRGKSELNLLNSASYLRRLQTAYSKHYLALLESCNKMPEEKEKTKADLVAVKGPAASEHKTASSLGSQVGK